MTESEEGKALTLMEMLIATLIPHQRLFIFVYVVAMCFVTYSFRGDKKILIECYIVLTDLLCFFLSFDAIIYGDVQARAFGGVIICLSCMVMLGFFFYKRSDARRPEQTELQPLQPHIQTNDESAST
jgi:Ca2+/Na+ antiporter